MMQTPSARTVAALLRDKYNLRMRGCKPFRAGVMNANLLAGTDRGRMVLRVYGGKRLGATAFEREMLRRLAATGFPCPAPLRTRDGTDTVMLAGRPAILYPYIEGTPATAATPALLRRIGELQGRIHARFRARPAPVRKPGWEPQDLRRMLPRWRRRIIASGFPDARRHLDFLARELATCRFPRTLPRGWTHQDIKPENVLLRGGRVSGILDFDNCYEGALLHDVTTTVIWWCFPDGCLDERLLLAFLRGYDSRRRLTAAERRLLLGEGLRFRLVREMFIGPVTTLDRIPLAARRARRFRRIFRNLFGR